MIHAQFQEFIPPVPIPVVRAVRKQRTEEVFEFRCWSCHCTVELPVRQVRDGVGRCPRCDARVEIRWEAAQ